MPCYATLNSSHLVFAHTCSTWAFPQLIRSPQYVGPRAGCSCYTGRHYDSGDLHTANWCAPIGIDPTCKRVIIGVMEVSEQEYE